MNGTSIQMGITHMILIDINQLIIANLMQVANGKNKIPLDEGMIRHMVLNTIRSYNKQFHESYGEVVICCDSRKYWRKDYFPYYKANRKKDRDDSRLDWNFIFTTIDRIKDELKEFLPYKVIEVLGAEADDIIGYLTARYSNTQDILILSSDKDFVQLQKYQNVTQYSPILKKFLTTEDPLAHIIEHVIHGDRGDGIPNILSADDVFVKGERQKAVTSKKSAEWLKQALEDTDFCTTDEMRHGFERNAKLIVLQNTPQEIKEEIQKVYNETVPAPRSGLISYFMAKQLSNLLTSIGDF